MTLLTALEIFTHPNDLLIAIVQEKGGTKFAISISRGPGHNFKVMLSSQPFVETLDAAIGVIKEILECVYKSGIEEFKDPKSISSQYLNPDGREIDQSKILNPELIQRILEELRKNRVASTYNMLAPA